MQRLVLDVSNNNPIDVRTARAAGAVALIAKETEGTSFRDGTAARHRAVARQLGIPFGGYVFLHVAHAEQQARNFLAYADLRPGDLQPIIDAEVTDARTIAQVAAAIDAAARVLERHGYRPILYVPIDLWHRIVAELPALKRLRIWEPQYPGRFTLWAPSLARLRVRLRHGASVVLWQWTDRYQALGRHYDASRLLVRLDSLRIGR